MATRLPVALAAHGGWRDTTLDLPDGPWTDVLTGRAPAGGPLDVGTMLASYPVALLVRSD